MKDGRSHCMFCDKDFLYGMCSDKDIRHVVKSLKSFPLDLQEKALEYVAEEHMAYIKRELTSGKRCEGHAISTEDA